MYIQCIFSPQELPSLVRLLQKNGNPITWKPVTNLPVKMHSAYVVRINTVLYVTGGVCSSENVDLSKLLVDSPSQKAVASSCVFMYDIFIGTWSTLLLLKHKSAVPHVVSGKLVLFGGLDMETNKITNHVSIYNPKIKSWTNDYPNLLEQRLFPAIVSWGDYVIVVGGKQREDILNDIEVMDTKNCHWIKVETPLPKKMFSLSATISNDMLYLSRTYGLPPPSTSAQVYYIPIKDVVTKSSTTQSQNPAPHSRWSSLPDVPYINATIVPDAHPPMIVGGSDPRQGNTVEDIIRYSMESNSWEKVGSLPSKLANTAVTTISNHAIIVFGGCESSKTRDTCSSSAIDTVQLGYIDTSA